MSAPTLRPLLKENTALIPLQNGIDAPGVLGLEEVLQGAPATYSVRARDARAGRNPRTGEAVDVRAKHVPFFKSGKELRERLNADDEG